MKKTDWFAGHIKPVRAGVYERQWLGDICYSRWDFDHWTVVVKSVDDADRSKRVSLFQSLKWRGLASDPKGKK